VDKPQHLTEINGKVLLIVGYGSIGREAAETGQRVRDALWGCNAIRRGRPKRMRRKIFPATKLHESLPEADYVLIVAPETAETRHLMGAAEIAENETWRKADQRGAAGRCWTRRRCCGRLESGALGGAAIDVAKLEPLPAESPPLEGAEFVDHTTHQRGERPALGQAAGVLLELLERWFDGRELFNRVDFARGY